MNRIFLFLFVVLLSFPVYGFDVSQNANGNVLTDDVLYVYRLSSRIDWNVVSFFEEKGFDVILLNERDLPVEFSDFVFVYVGDDRFRRAALIPVGDVPVIVSNYFNTEAWGLTDRDGASQMGATSPLKVLEENDLSQVYDRAFRRGRLAVPYYYLEKNNVAPDLRQVASTQPTSSGRRFGDVISYGEPGDRLANGNIVSENFCYFGIIRSEFWTNRARELFSECVDFVSN